MDTTVTQNKVCVRLIIRPNDVATIYSIGYEQGRRRLKVAKDALAKKNVSIREFCSYEGLDYTQVCNALNVKPV